MEAAEAKVQKVLEGSKQFLVPHYQRPYSWREEHWRTLWNDIHELVQEPDSKPHFMGSIVTSPARSVPEGVEKRLLIDGQQRLTTILVLLTLIRDRARERGLPKLADRIQDLVTNRHEDGHDHYKLLPTQGEVPAESDRDIFVRLVESAAQPSPVGIGAAYQFFDAKLRRSDAPDLEALARTITARLTLVSIILDENDNPHRIFESLNGKGRPLSQADLIRNYFFMRLHEREHERVYVNLWRPMQQRLGEEALTDFVRHYLMRMGQPIRETDVYAALKEHIDQDRPVDPIRHLKELARFSEYYAFLRTPETAPSPRIRERLERLNRLQVTVAYPFLLSVFADHAAGKLNEPAVVAVLDTLENYVVRRFVCGVPTYGLNKIFPPLYQSAVGADGDFVRAVQKVLAANSQHYPRDDTFRKQLTESRLYGGGERREKTRLLLERLELAFGHKETALQAPLTIEHVMPRNLTDEWRKHLGANAEDDHEVWLHTLGNLTLTSYNAELGDAMFGEKKKILGESHIELNRYFQGCDRWTASDIERRAQVLADSALSVWPYFGATASKGDSAVGSSDVTGTVPRAVRFRGVETAVQSWVDVAVATAEGIATIGDEEFDRVASEFPRFMNRDATAFRRSSRFRKLSNGAYVETNLSASSTYRLCVQATQLAGLGPGEWHVELSKSDDDEEEESPQTPSHVRQLQHTFWTQTRDALEKTGQFTSLRPARPQYWFDIALGRTDVWMSLTANTEDRMVSVKINFRGEAAHATLERILSQRAIIESEVGTALQWNPHPEKRTRTVRLTIPCDLEDSSRWPVVIAWLARTAAAFRAAFGARIIDPESRPPK